MTFLSVIQKADIYNMIYLVVALLVGLFFGLERSYRGKVNALTTYVAISLSFSAVTIAISYLTPIIDSFVVGLLFLGLIIIISMIRLWRKDNLDDLSSATLLVSGVISIILPLGNYFFSLILFLLTIGIYTLVYLLNIYVERRKYCLTIIVNQEENILLKVLDICDEVGTKISHFTSSIILTEDKNALRLEILFKYGTPKAKVKEVFEKIKEINILNIVFHGDIHKMEWK